MSRHKEIVFEDEIVEHLTKNGWHTGHPAGYSRELGLYLPDVREWLEQVWPEEWAKVEKMQGENTAKVLSERLAEVLDKEGPLHVLRRGFKQINARFEMCAFEPETSFNVTTRARFEQVRCTVMRQVRYSRHHEGRSIDLVFFVNGIPVATAELKTEFTQTVHDAIRQYRHDRLPRDPKANADEPLLQFNRRALVHFAVSTEEVWMTTRLAGKDTRFLPFNRGDKGGGGNPANPEGYRTEYLWKQVLERSNWLDILGRFVHLEKKTEKDRGGRTFTKETLIFPRYHQWRAVKKLVQAARREGPGQNYLIQHSAGSGKSNSIAWLAHRLSTLHDENDEKVFHSAIVVTDRNILDSQLRDTIYQFEHKPGVVAGITRKGGSKTSQLTVELASDTPIIIVTLQTFPFVLKAIQQQTSLRERRYAVIADEAHSSQTGTTARDLAKVLSSEQDDGMVKSFEDIMHDEMEQRAAHPNVSYFAFTATPKAKTLERFGRLPDPSQPPSPSNKPEAFDVYSMQQAIEERFILDVLKNYTPYQLAFQLAYQGREYEVEEVDQSRARRSLMQWVHLHPDAISQKAEIIIEHYRQNIAPLLGGKGKAMVVTSSRKAAVRYKLAIDEQIRSKGYNIGTLVAFSGKVEDEEHGTEPFTENNMNEELRGRDIRAAFDTRQFQLLIVANKFQTGFDQPLLCGMYVDKRLDGIMAVQTLSRLNRIYRGKDTVYILDFVNEPQEILEAFLPYYKTAELSNVSDPNQIHTLQTKLDNAQIYTAAEIEHFAEAFYDRHGKQAQLQAHLAPAVDRFKDQWLQAREQQDKKAEEELQVFRKDLVTFVRMYDFLSQIIHYGDTELEGRSIFFRHLHPLIEIENLNEAIDLSKVELSEYRLRQQEARDLALAGAPDDAETELTPASEAGSGAAREAARARLEEVIEQINALFEGESSLTDTRSLVYSLRDKMLENPVLHEQAYHNTEDQFALGDFQKELESAMVSSLESYQSKVGQLFANRETLSKFSALLVGEVYKEALKLRHNRGGQSP